MAVHQGRRRRRLNLGWSTGWDEWLLQMNDCFRLFSLNVYLVSKVWGYFYTLDSVHESAYQYHYWWWIVTIYNDIKRTRYIKNSNLRKEVGIAQAGRQAGWQTICGWIWKSWQSSTGTLFGFFLCLQQCNVIRNAFSLLFSNKAYFRVCFVVAKYGSHFLCQSLLLGTSTPNDYS